MTAATLESTDSQQASTELASANGEAVVRLKQTEQEPPAIDTSAEARPSRAAEQRHRRRLLGTVSARTARMWRDRKTQRISVKPKTSLRSMEKSTKRVFSRSTRTR